MRERMEEFYKNRSISDASLLHRWHRSPAEDGPIKVYPKQFLAALFKVNEKDIICDYDHNSVNRHQAMGIVRILKFNKVSTYVLNLP